MRTMILVALAAAVTAPAISVAQEAGEPEKPKTKLEAFVAQDGVVIIRGSSKVGDIRGQYGSAVMIEAKEFTNASSGRREHGITVEVKEGGRLEREHTSFVDFDEIPSLLKGLEYIGKVEKSATALDQFQADYRTKGDLVVSTFNTEGGETRLGVSSGRIGRTRAFLPISDLERMRELIQNAYARLEGIRTPSK
jgi:hypothetical protein